ncbi:MAG TPA: hypothetical protein VFN04_02260, partial [Protaetiibacter sp.]|nr:hypothetical protein [Protaetiibacter sp.]
MTQSERNIEWASTMHGHDDGAVRRAHVDTHAAVTPIEPRRRAEREDAEDAALAAGATRARGAGSRAVEEEP